MGPDQPLRYPPHYPPTDRWKKFFIGVRWLGPDLSFFSQLRSQQGSRTASSLDIWGGGDRQALAAMIGEVLSTRIRWPSPYFVPGDHVSVAFGGPEFQSMDGDLGAENALRDIEERLGVPLGRTFRDLTNLATLGDLVDALTGAREPTDLEKHDL